MATANAADPPPVLGSRLAEQGCKIGWASDIARTALAQEPEQDPYLLLTLRPQIRAMAGSW